MARFVVAMPGVVKIPVIPVMMLGLVGMIVIIVIVRRLGGVVRFVA